MIGCGDIANYVHLPGLKSCPNVRIVAGCDANEANLALTDEAFGLLARHRATATFHSMFVVVHFSSLPGLTLLFGMP